MYNNSTETKGGERYEIARVHKIRAMRKGYGFTQKYMAENLGMSVSTYQNKEKGRVRFSDKEKVSMARISNFQQIR